MTVEIAIALAIVVGALAPFVSEWVRNDIAALLVLLAVALTGLVEPRAALSGLSNPAVPVAHPTNLLIMVPGGYRFTDYTKVGLPLTLLCLIVVLVVLPLVWPLTP